MTLRRFLEVVPPLGLVRAVARVFDPLPMSTPSFGLSHDYDEFLLGIAGPLIALVLGVARDHDELRTEFVGAVVPQNLVRCEI